MVKAVDPNDKTGRAGAGPEKFVLADSLLPYTVRFENLATATAPAQEVVITDTLDADLDWSTFELTGIGFNDVVIDDIPAGLQQYSTQVSVASDPNPVDVEVSFDANTGAITWHMRSIDPITGGLPEDPLAGFLPPNDAEHRGEGYVTYTVLPLAGLPTGTVIGNEASIVFDVNEPIVTNEVINTIDAGAPTSAVDAFPTEYIGTDVLVSWTGHDENGTGSGIASYDIYVATDRGPYKLWKQATADTSATFTGQIGRTYAFYSVATDGVGHVEQPPMSLDAQTTLVEPPMDFGDAPLGAQSGFAADYPTQLADDGARHVIVDGSPYLGSIAPDDEPDGQPDADAAGDDNVDDDEDGVDFTIALIPGNQVDATVTVTGAGYLNAWMDFNADGDWGDPDEQIITDLWLETGTHQPDFDVPYDATIGQTYARFRYSSTAGLAPTSRADDGEVEDYLANVIPAGSISGYVYADVNDNGIREDHELGLPNVPVTLEGPVSGTVTTGADGYYEFSDLPRGTYTVIQTQPQAFNDGKDTQGTPVLGSVENDRFVGIQLTGATEATDYNFGECGLIGKLVSMSFRQNNAPSSQELIAQLNVMTGEWYAFRAAGNGTFNAHAEAEGVGLELYTADLMPVTIGATGELSAPVAEGEGYVLHVTGDAQAVSVLLSIEDIVRQYLTNPGNAFDVTGDGYVSPLDVLAIVAELNQAGSLATSATDYFYDVTGDGRATPLDVLTVISHLNANLNGGGENEPVGQAVPDGLAAITDVGWAEPLEAHQNTLAISHDAHRSQSTTQSGGPAFLGPPYDAPNSPLWRGLPTTPPATGGVGRPAPNADSVRQSLTYSEVDPVLLELDSVLPEILEDVDGEWQQLGSD